MDIDGLIMKAQRIREAGNYIEAENILQKCINIKESKKEAEPSVSIYLSRIYNELGLLNYMKVEFTDAINNFSKALEIDPSFDICYYNRGLIHYRLGSFEEALDDMEKILQSIPDFESAVLCRKEILMHLSLRNRDVS